MAMALAEKVLEVIPLLMDYIRSEMRSDRHPDLSLPQFRTLLFCRRQPGASLSALASHQGISLASASRMVDSLVKRHLLVRKIGQDDRRQLELYLSQRGLNLLSGAEKDTVSDLREKIKKLPDSEARKIEESLSRLLQIFNLSENVATSKNRDLKKHF
ncbi:MAG: MarR family winged helix-turn-helix transcriptional regulator [Candidatus Saccharicenans sp.]|nr:MAG: MarR family transcriptional regulator [Candidatus Aminicenantes bacterium]HEK86030.1 MarR family transcriptional regulator [Candidatus Aminicenantes bacterium]